MLGALRGYFASPSFETWLSEALGLARRAREKAKRDDDSTARLEHEVRALEARVENVTEAVAKLGPRDHLVAKLGAEEARLLDARAALAKASRPAPTAARVERQVSVRQMLAVLAHVEEAARRSPAKAQEALAGIVRSVTLTPTAESWRAALAFNGTAPLVLVQGGRFDGVGCGGGI